MKTLLITCLLSLASVGADKSDPAARWDRLAKRSEELGLKEEEDPIAWAANNHIRLAHQSVADFNKEKTAPRTKVEKKVVARDDFLRAEAARINKIAQAAYAGLPLPNGRDNQRKMRATFLDLLRKELTLLVKPSDTQITAIKSVDDLILFNRERYLWFISNSTGKYSLEIVIYP
jgi:hypothetical protein